MDALDGFLKEQQFKRSQQPFDPDKLPFGTPDPKKMDATCAAQQL